METSHTWHSKRGASSRRTTTRPTTRAPELSRPRATATGLQRGSTVCKRKAATKAGGSMCPMDAKGDMAQSAVGAISRAQTTRPGQMDHRDTKASAGSSARVTRSTRTRQTHTLSKVKWYEALSKS